MFEYAFQTVRLCIYKRNRMKLRWDHFKIQYEIFIQYFICEISSIADRRIYSRIMIWNKSNIPKEKDLASNIDWWFNKKSYRQWIISHTYKPEHIIGWIQFKLSWVIWIQEIQVRFINFWTSDSHIYIKPSSVVVEVRITKNEAFSTCVLIKIDDKGLSNFRVIIYGACWNSFNTKSKSMILRL